jgi:hypothetical protein
MEPLQPTPPWQRPRLIRDLGIASFINTGFFAFLYGVGMLFSVGVQQMPYNEFEAGMRPQLELYSGGEDIGPMLEMMAIFHAHGVALMALLFLRTVARLVGVIGLWQGKAWGFQVYAVAQLAGIFLPHIILPWNMLGLGGPLLAIGMTALYGTQRKFLR